MPAIDLNPNRKAWVDAGYRHDMASALAAQPPIDSAFLRLYHLTSEAHAISNISLRRIKVSRFRELNDPFELYAPNAADGNVRKVLRDFKESVDKEIGLICFSEDWHEPLLWSHYADKHRGICLGFDVRRDTIERVKYSKQRSELSMDEVSRGELSGKTVSSLLKTKFTGWKYEREHRRIVPLSEASQEGSIYFVPFGDDLVLREVIAGAASDLDIHRLRYAVKQSCPSAVVYQARLMFKGFNIVPRESTIDLDGLVPELRDAILRPNFQPK